jgi:hypothetical protein
MKKQFPLFGLAFIIAFVLIGNLGQASASGSQTGDQPSGVGRVSMLVLDNANGTPIPNAFVQMKSVDSPLPTIITGYTSATGVFSAKVPAGMYSVQVKAAKYALGYAKVQVTPNAPKYLKVGLNSAPGPVAVP